MSSEQRLLVRHERSKPLWEELHVWLQLERKRVPDGTKAIDYRLNHWEALSRFLLDGEVPIETITYKVDMPSCLLDTTP